MSQNICKEEIFKSIFINQSERVRNYLYYKSGSLATAEDLVQEAFCKLWENCNKIQPEKAKSYLYTVATNLFLNKVKRNKVELSFLNESLEINNAPSPQYQLEMKEFRIRLEKGISSLPEGQREVFLMNRIDGKKYKEIAQEIGISVKAVEKRMHKALFELRKVHNKV